MMADEVPEIERVVPAEVRALLERRDGARLVVEALNRAFPMTGDAPTTHAQRAWELCGLHFLNQGRESWIKQHPILEWNIKQFAFYLSKPDTRLMVIGYSFRDEHVNQIIGSAAEVGNIELFLVSPRGVEVIYDREYTHPLGSLSSILQSRIVGASQRPLRGTFGGDRIEYSKLMRFFS